MPAGRKYGGRRKGTPNKVTTSAKDCIAMTAKALGGHKRLAEWAKESKENEKAFWTQIYPKILPHQITGDSDNPLTVVVEKP